MKRRHIIVAVALCWRVALSPARADETMQYVVRQGDTLQLLAAEFYGDRALAVFIAAVNKRDGNRAVRPGDKLRLPATREVITSPGDTFANLAESWLGDKRRSTYLARWNGLTEADGLAAGTTLVLPVHVTHVAKKGETFASISLRYFGSEESAEVLRQYNFVEAGGEPTLRQRLIVPAHQMRLRTTGAPMTLVDDSSARNDRRQRVQQAVATALPNARAAYRAGDYAATKRELTGLDVDYLETIDAMQVGVLLGASYIAFGDTDSARTLFRRVREKRPDMELSDYLYSPSIRKVWAEASQGAANDGGLSP